MRLLFYFFIIINVAILLLNWDKINAPKTTLKTEEAQLVLANETPSSLTARSQQLPTISQPTSATRTIDKIWDFLVDIWRLLMNALFPTDGSDGSLPNNTTISEEPTPSYCFDIGPFKEAKAALMSKELLMDRGLTTELRVQKEETQVTESKAKYVVIARVRSNLDTAKELSDLLSQNAIPQTIKENSPLGYILQTPILHSESAAKQTLQKMQKIGMSAYMRQIGKATQSVAPSVQNIYYLRVNKQHINLWEQLNQKEDLRALIKPNIRFQRIEPC